MLQGQSSRTGLMETGGVVAAPGKSPKSHQVPTKNLATFPGLLLQRAPRHGTSPSYHGQDLVILRQPVQKAPIRLLRLRTPCSALAEAPGGTTGPNPPPGHGAGHCGGTGGAGNRVICQVQCSGSVFPFCHGRILLTFFLRIKAGENALITR